MRIGIAANKVPGVRAALRKWQSWKESRKLG
jgi:ribose 5-phosphate isomerase RpiB